MVDDKISHVAIAIKELYAIVKRLENSFPGRHFTPDGHLVGSIGEVLASYYYGLELLPASFETHDSKAPDGKMVQIKATQCKMIGLSSEPERLIVLKILPDGHADEVYNGPGKLVWDKAGNMQKNGHRNITVNTLKGIMKDVGKEFRVLRVNEG